MRNLDKSYLFLLSCITLITLQAQYNGHYSFVSVWRFLLLILVQKLVQSKSLQKHSTQKLLTLHNNKIIINLWLLLLVTTNIRIFTIIEHYFSEKSFKYYWIYIANGLSLVVCLQMYFKNENKISIEEFISEKE